MESSDEEDDEIAPSSTGDVQEVDLSLHLAIRSLCLVVAGGVSDI